MIACSCASCSHDQHLLLVNGGGAWFAHADVSSIPINSSLHSLHKDDSAPEIFIELCVD